MKRIDLNLSRTIAATPTEVYDVWLDPKSPGGPWFGADRVILNAVPDGLFYHSVNHQDRVWAHYGRFLRLERGQVIEHTWMSEATRGFDTVVTITLEKTSDGTLLSLRHVGVPDDELGRSHAEGWGFIISAIEQRFPARKSA